MTGRYDEFAHGPEAGGDQSDASPRASGGDEQSTDAVGEPALWNRSDAQQHARGSAYADPSTSPAARPVDAHPIPSYVDPSVSRTNYPSMPGTPGGAGNGSGSTGATGYPATGQPDRDASGPQPPPAGYYTAPPNTPPPWQQPSAPPAGTAQPPPAQPASGPSAPQQPAPPQPPQAQQPQPQQPQPEAPAQPVRPEQPLAQQDLSSAQLLPHGKRAPQSGWRKALYVASGRKINPGESAADQQRRELIKRINQPLHGCYKIAMLSLKGGVGKTITTATLGSTFSSLRGDRVIAVDANPDRGTLSQKIPAETSATVRHLLRDAQHVRRYSDVRSYTSQGPSRLEVLASEQDPAVSEAFSENDYHRTVDLLEHFYNVVLTDCGTGLMHSAMKGVLGVADSLIVVSSASIDGARSASATLDWLDAHGYGGLVSRSIAVINSVRPGSGKVDVDKLSAHFAQRCRAVQLLPFDEHLEEGAEIELDQLESPTRMALLELAALVADDFPRPIGR